MNKAGPDKVTVDDVKWLILILIIAFTLRLFFVLNSRTPTMKDGARYDTVAMSLVNGKGFSLDGQSPTSLVPPFYPFFLASIYAVFGHNLKIALMFQAFLGAIGALLIFYLAIELFKDKKIAFIASFIYSVYYYFIREGELLWTEPIFIFLIILMSFCYVKFIGLDNKPSAVSFGLSCAALVLTRPIALFLPFIFIGKEFFRLGHWQRKKLFMELRYLNIALFFFLMPIGLWALRNFAVQKEFVLVATGGGGNFYEGFKPYEGKKYGFTVRDELVIKGESIPSEVLRDRFYFKEGMKLALSKGLPELLRLTLLKGMHFWSLIDWGPMANGRVAFNFCTSFILPFSLISVILLRRNKLALTILFVPIAYFFFFSLVFYGMPRFRLPTEPFMIVLASYSIAHFYRRFSKKAIPTTVILSWLGINLWFFANSYQTKEYLKKIIEIIGLW